MKYKTLTNTLNTTNSRFQLDHWFVAFFGLFLLLIISGFALIPSFYFALYSLTLSFLGQFVFKGFIKRSDFNHLELLGSGIAVGTIIPAVINFIIQTYSDLPPITALIIFCVIGITLAHKNVGSTQLVESRNRYQLVLLSLAASAFAFAQFSHIFYIPGIMLLLFIYATNSYEYIGDWKAGARRAQSFAAVSSIFLLGLWLLAKLTSSPPIWRQLTYIDQLFDETQSWSIARYGFNENPFAAGNTLPGHTLTHSWAGLSQVILQLPSFMASGSAGVLLALMGTCALLGGFAYRTRKNITSIVGVFLLWTFQMSVSDQFGVAPNPRIANSLSLLWFLFTVLLILELTRKDLRSPYLLIPIFIGFTGFGKIHWAVFILVCFGVVSFFEFIVRRASTNFVISILSFVSLISVYFFYIYGLNAYATFAIHFSLSNLLLYSAVLINRSLGVYISSKSYEQSYLQKLLLVALVFSPLFIALTGTTNQQTYFITCSLLIISLMHGPQLIATMGSVCRPSKLFRFVLGLFGLFTLGISIAATGYYWKVFENAEKSEFGMKLFSLIKNQEIYLTVICVILSVVFFAFFSIKAREKRTLGFFMSVLATLLFTANTSAFLAQSTRTMITDRLYGRQLTELALSDDQISIGSWVRLNSNSESVLATNHYCQVPVAVNQRVPISPEDCRQRNMNSWLSATSHRRLFLEAPIVSIFGPGKIFSAEEAALFNLSLRIGQLPSDLDIQTLEQAGVDLFVAENKFTAVTELSNLRDVVYSNASYTVFQLNPSN